MKAWMLAPLFGFVASCTSVQVSELDAVHQMTHVCIKENPKVVVGEFLGVIEDGFQDHLITTEVYTRSKPDHCQFYLTYTALQSWDFTPFLSHAELRLYEDNRRIASAQYHLRGKGGLSLTKWASVKSKMTPVIEKLLAQYK